MSNNFLSNYTIPIVNNSHYGKEFGQSSANEVSYNYNELAPSGDYNGYDNGYAQQDANRQQYQNPSRFVPPGKPAGRFNTKPARAQKRKFPKEAGDSKDTYEDRFMGRCDDYPGELNVLFKSLNCELCNVQFNSAKTAHIHYESKAHDKNITSWLKRNYTDNGLEPPTLKRFYDKSGPVGPDAFYCEHCDLKLTSKAHAAQHYTGRKHTLVISNISKPSGSGYYNDDGKWVRTGTKATPIVDNDGRFGIGEDFKKMSTSQENLNIDAATNIQEVSSVAKASELAVASALATPATVALIGDDPLQCKLCDIKVTSPAQLTVHFQGAKHLKKLKTSVDPQTGPVATSETVLSATVCKSAVANDYSMFRTPSGSYYCNTCNMPMNNEVVLAQHLAGKKHLKNCAAEKAAASEKSISA